jgi:transposase
MQIASVGIDLGKTTFHLVALDDDGQVVIKKKFSRKQLLAYTANLPTSLVGIEACSGHTSSGPRCATRATKCGSFRRSL